MLRAQEHHNPLSESNLNTTRMPLELGPAAAYSTRVVPLVRRLGRNLRHVIFTFSAVSKPAVDVKK